MIRKVNLIQFALVVLLIALSVSSQAQITYIPLPVTGGESGNGLFDSQNEEGTFAVKRALLDDSLLLNARTNQVTIDSINSNGGFDLYASDWTGAAGSGARLNFGGRRMDFEHDAPQFRLDALSSSGAVGGALSFLRGGSTNSYFQLEGDGDVQFNHFGDALGASDDDTSKLLISGDLGNNGFGVHIGYVLEDRPGYLSLETRASQDNSGVHQGVLFSPMTTAQRDGINGGLNLLDGTMIYNTDDNTYQFYDAGTWFNMSGGGGVSSFIAQGDDSVVISTNNITQWVDGTLVSRIQGSGIVGNKWWFGDTATWSAINGGAAWPDGYNDFHVFLQDWDNNGFIRAEFEAAAGASMEFILEGAEGYASNIAFQEGNNPGTIWALGMEPDNNLFLLGVVTTGTELPSVANSIMYVDAGGVNRWTWQNATLRFAPGNLPAFGGSRYSLLAVDTVTGDYGRIDQATLGGGGGSPDGDGIYDGSGTLSGLTNVDQSGNELQFEDADVVFETAAGVATASIDGDDFANRSRVFVQGDVVQRRTEPATSLGSIGTEVTGDQVRFSVFRVNTNSHNTWTWTIAQLPPAAISTFWRGSLEATYSVMQASTTPATETNASTHKSRFEIAWRQGSWQVLEHELYFAKSGDLIGTNEGGYIDSVYVNGSDELVMICRFDNNLGTEVYTQNMDMTLQMLNYDPAQFDIETDVVQTVAWAFSNDGGFTWAPKYFSAPKGIPTFADHDAADSDADLRPGDYYYTDLGRSPNVKGSGPAFGYAVRSESSAYTATVTDRVVLCDANSAAFTVTLPAASSSAGVVLAIKKTDVSGNVVTVDGNASETIDGSITFTLPNQYDSVTIVCDGSNWHVL